MGARAILREGSGKIGPVITDNGNFVVDADFGIIEDPEKLDGQLGIIPGVVETGLFVDMVDEVYVGKSDGNVTIEKNH
jgi:ribose 5-phosphate isomerase A